MNTMSHKNIERQYGFLVSIVNDNLKNKEIHQLVFEKYDGLYEDIFNFPIKKLLNVEDNSSFIYEAYYKILDRVVDKDSYHRFLGLLNDKKVTKDQIISTLSNSKERMLKKTNLSGIDTKAEV